MPDRSRNRPRIAGQRRTAVDVTTNDIETAPEVSEEIPETPAEDVTPATPEAPEAPGEEVPEAPAVTHGDAKPGLGRLLTAALGVAVVLVLTVAVVLGVKAWQGKQAEDARDQAAAAGRKAAETILSYDYRNLDKNFAASEAVMTPDYAGKFGETAKVVRVLATQQKTTVRADVREVGVRDGDADRVTLIIFVNQTTTNSETTKSGPRVDLNRTRFTMVRNGDQWLVQDIAGL